MFRQLSLIQFSDIFFFFSTRYKNFCLLTESFAILEPRNPPIEECYAFQNRHVMVEGSKCWEIFGRAVMHVCWAMFTVKALLHGVNNREFVAINRQRSK